ncbi:MAG: methylated-DNA--[protein]-cysteine S-methyltransferase [Chlamydiae bacterium]|nr:methylated-DNA--[protein]-cysteine S-methyltransferase [Chlamydiota bacterium]MBI3276502.1 methylated-DNA--[protein]-cysteine S-methyltransferase [Chlamydiota bacterium]
MSRISFKNLIGILEIDFEDNRINRIRILPITSSLSKKMNSSATLTPIIQKIQDYFQGKKVDFQNIPLLFHGVTPPPIADLSGQSDEVGSVSGGMKGGGVTPLQKEILERVRKIPYGMTKSYGEIAKEFGNRNLARAVGQACKANPFPILVPCHRVIQKGGGLGGYSQGLEIKKKLLEMERGK